MKRKKRKEKPRIFTSPSKNELKYGVKLPPEEGTMVFLDMLIHDCRQYLMIATGELKSIEEEGELELDDPTEDIHKITIRLKRLKNQCMRMAGKRPLDWQR